MARIPARPTIYNGTKMRSRLEARFAGILDGHGIKWEYEGPAYAEGSKQYLPDFTLPIDWVAKWIIDVKPHLGYDGYDEDVGLDDWLDRMQPVYTMPPDPIGIEPAIAIASPSLGDFLYVEHRWCGSGKRVRGLAAFFKEHDGVLLMPLFGSSDGAYYIGDGPLHLDWGWRS